MSSKLLIFLAMMNASATFCSRSFHPIRCDFVAAFSGRTGSSALNHREMLQLTWWVNAANAVHSRRNLAVKNRQPKRLDLDLLPDPFLDVGLRRKPVVEIGSAWKFGEHHRSDHLAVIIENCAGRTQLAPFDHRLDTCEVSRPHRRPARLGLVVSAIVRQHEKLHHWTPYSSCTARDVRNLIVAGEPVTIRKELLGAGFDLRNVDISAGELPDVVKRVPEGHGDKLDLIVDHTAQQLRTPMTRHVLQRGERGLGDVPGVICGIRWVVAAAPQSRDHPIALPRTALRRPACA